MYHFSLDWFVNTIKFCACSQFVYTVSKPQSFQMTLSHNVAVCNCDTVTYPNDMSCSNTTSQPLKALFLLNYLQWILFWLWQTFLLFNVETSNWEFKWQKKSIELLSERKQSNTALFVFSSLTNSVCISYNYNPTSNVLSCYHFIVPLL